ncbi:MAG: DUF4132 domain-containing protein [Akkermansiaceae bacterium]
MCAQSRKIDARQAIKHAYPDYMEALEGVMEVPTDTTLDREANYGTILKTFPGCKLYVTKSKLDDDALCQELLDLVKAAEKSKCYGDGPGAQLIHSPLGAVWAVKLVASAMMSCFLRKKGLILKVETIQPLMEFYQSDDWWYSSMIDFGLLLNLVENLEIPPEKTREHFGTWLEQRLEARRAWSYSASLKKEKKRLEFLLADDSGPALLGRDAWAALLLQDYREAADPESLDQLFDLIGEGAGKTRPSAKWLKAAQEYVSNVNTTALCNHLERWFDAVGQPAVNDGANNDYEWLPAEHRGMMLDDGDSEYLRGLVWLAALVPGKQMARALSDLIFTAYKKVPGIGPRAVKIGNAGVNTLGLMEHEAALAELAKLKVKVKFGTAQNLIAKALDAKAEAMGVSRNEVEEMAVPDYGFNTEHIGEIPAADFTALLEIISSNKVAITWRNTETGKVQKSVPAKVREQAPDELKEIRATAKDVQKMIPVVQERLDGMYLEKREWDLTTWKTRYLHHPIVGWVSKRLIWNLTEGKTTTAVFCVDGQFYTLDGSAHDASANTTVSLWHPLDSTTEETLAWREFILDRKITQPFKQAYREIYLLTDAERNTNNYSNRYAAHIIKQHQFNALCAARGWKNKLRLMVDDEYPPAMRHLEAWKLRADFWIEGAGEDYGTDTLESGAFIYLTTDQVRFYEEGAATSTAHACGGGYTLRHAANAADPLPLENIPALVFSEVMRDVDLFVGVASVGNNTSWEDTGNTERQQYWESFSFGDLGETAKTRKTVLERLIPRMKIADRCSFADKYLIVRGDIRTYKIHLGSTNIIMEPNDQYLCIVAQGSRARAADKLYLPFEGDTKLSVIISKAILLADDTKIKDATILSQINQQR